MKIRLLGLLLLALSQPGYSQVLDGLDGILGDGSGFLGLPNKHERLVRKCEDFIGELNNSLGVSNSGSDYCNSNSLDKIMNSKKQIKACLTKTLQVTQVSNDTLKFCLDDTFMHDLDDPKLLGCFADTLQIGFNKNDQSRIEICRDKATINLVKDDNFLSCLQFLKKNKPEQTVKERVVQCENPDALGAIKSPLFTSCRSTVSHLGFSPVRTINFCLSKENQDPRTVKRVENCRVNLSSAMSDEASFKYCLDFKSSGRLQDEKMLSCFTNSIKSVSATYFDDTFDKADQVIYKFSDILDDCQSGAPKGNPKLKLHGAYYFSAKEKFDNTIVGGLSGIAYDPKKDVYYVVSDDPGQRNPSRFYTMKASLKNGVRMDILAKTTLSNDTDAESIQILDDGNFAISSETLVSGAKSFIKIYDPKGKHLDEIAMPKKFKHKTENVETSHGSIGGGYAPGAGGGGWTEYKEVNSGGMQHNLGLESLGIPENNKNVLFTVSEAPLIQDIMKKGRIVRLVKITKNNKGKFTEQQEFGYAMENSKMNGISDVLPLNDHELLVLERRYDFNNNKVTSQIFEIDITGAKEISEIESFKDEETAGREIPVVKKKLLMNLDDIVPSLPAGFRSLDNTEGMVLGPDLGNGTRALIIVTDNNFSEKQLNQVLVLEFPKR